MKQSFACLVLVLFCFAATIYADDCNSPLLAAFSITGLTTPTTVSGLKYCKSIQNSASCCSADTVNAFQTKATTLSQKLSGYVATRDKNIVQARDATIPQMKAQFQAFKDAFNKFSSSTQSSTGTSDTSGIDTKALVVAVYGALIAVSDQIYETLDSLKTGFSTYQKSRSTCVIQLLKLQASAWCLACDPKYASKGASGTAVTMSSTVCNRLQSACYDYITGSVLQGTLLSLASQKTLFQTMTDSLNSGSVLTTTGTTTTTTGTTGSSTQGQSTDTLVASVPAYLPANCASATSCPWICTTLFDVSTSKITELPLAIGGSQTQSTSRLLVEDTHRELQQSTGSSSWSPEEDEAGVTITFADDPGNTASTSTAKGGSLLGVGLTCMLGMLVTLLF